MCTLLDDLHESFRDDLVLLRAPDLIERGIVPNRKTLREWMKRKHDPFPAPLVMTEGKQQTDAEGNLLPRFSGRHVAWRLSDVAAWLDRRQQKAG